MRQGMGKMPTSYWEEEGVVEKVFSELTEGDKLGYMCMCFELVSVGENRCLEGYWALWRGLALHGTRVIGWFNIYNPHI